VPRLRHQSAAMVSMALAMRIIVEGVQKLTDNKQQELGQSILVGMFHAGIRVDGVTVKFEEEDQ